MRGISKALTVGIIVLIVIIAGAIYYYASMYRKPAAESVIVIGVTDKVTDIDPANAYDFYTWEVLNNIMEGLTKYKPGTTDIVLGIAESYSVSSDGTVWTFKLRSNLKFADGTPCKAQDVARSIKRVMKIKGDPSWLVTSFVDNVTAVDDTTVKFTLKHPVSYFLALLATPPYFPVSPKYNPTKVDSDQTAGGVGPYMIAQWKRNELLVLKSNPNYYGDKPKTDKVVIKFYKSSSSLRLALESGEIDIAWRTLSPQDIKGLKTTSGITVYESPGAAIRYIILNTKMDPTSNNLVRKALAAAIDRKDICDRVFLGTMEPLYSLIPIGMWSHTDVFKDKYGEGPNLNLAKSLLQKAGYSETNKLKIELWYTTTHYGDTEADLATVLKQQWEATGLIEVSIKPEEWGAYVSDARKGVFMASLFGWYPDYIDPDDYTTPFLDSRANSWTGSGYSNDKLNSLLDQAAISTDINVRTNLYKQVQNILAEDVPIIPLVQGKLFIAYKSNVKGVVLDPVMLLRYYLIYKE